MNTTNSYERFPVWILLVSNAHSLAVYALGVYVLSAFGPWIASLFLLYCLGMELRLLTGSCKNCYYYGKVCGFGKGKLCSLFFKQGDPQKHSDKEITWRDLVPDMLVLVFPLIGGVISLFTNFSWTVVLTLVVLLILATSGNAYVRGSLVCKHCKQKETCPALKFFEPQQEHTPSSQD